MKLILLGPPGAGKGTQAERIAKKYSLAHISTGDMLRAEIALGTSDGIIAKGLIDAGNLVPDAMINRLLMQRLALEDCQDGFILDGYPRTMSQAETLSKAVQLDGVLNIDVLTEVLVARVETRRICSVCNYSQSKKPKNPEVCELCGGRLIQREDDNPKSVSHRLSIYNRMTLPLIEYFEKLNLLIKINGDQSIEQVSEEIFSRLKPIQERVLNVTHGHNN